jgi:hypothetical protein
VVGGTCECPESDPGLDVTMNFMGRYDIEKADRQAAFHNLPGTLVATRSAGGTKREYVQGDGSILATRGSYWRRNPLYPNPRVTVGRRVFEERLLGKRRNNHMRTPREVVDLETGTRLFRIDGLNFNRHANAVIRVSESCSYTFPVEGEKRAYPVMRAVDNAGRVPLQFGGVAGLEAEEMTIAPNQSITPELLVMMATASPFLAFFFLRPGD